MTTTAPIRVPRRARLLAVAWIAALALVATAPGVAGASGGGGAQVHTKKVKGQGTVLVDGSGHTLYVFSPDAKGAPTCSGACATIWPPLTTHGNPRAGHGVEHKHLGTVAGPHGTRQVTYDHWPLYTFVQDTKPGQATGQGISSFGGKWSTITRDGSAFGRSSATHHSSSSGSGTHGSGGSSGSNWGGSGY